MINQTHIVIDLETMGVGTNAAIVSIGAVRIERGQHAAGFYRRVDLASSLAHGGTTDASTISWWLKQSPEARGEVDGSEHPANLYDVLWSLRDFIQARDEPRLWGNGATFDLRILGEAYDAFHEGRPWDFRLERDLRTILELYPEARDVGEFEGIRHHALADACHEAKQLIKAIKLHQNRQPQAAAEAVSA
ncbi:putative Exodeoxyribonuclease I [Pseudomonas sp. OF001]|uniref:3'-5' exonuclease n=1 Tax=Pseudomonas sp. OF001 TaxID=2772300 RepID=UPI00191A3041|nr:3'-5' exonuclease [Pseudomonas sp. OF001]CAD5376749.1 putative Exodeoxyribonuclease I [Pseudomonas sp. OF001]